MLKNPSLYYDEKLKRWVDPNTDPNEADGMNAPPPPPKLQLMGANNTQKQPSATPIGASEKLPIPSVGNKFSAGMQTQVV